MAMAMAQPLSIQMKQMLFFVQRMLHLHVRANNSILIPDANSEAIGLRRTEASGNANANISSRGTGLSGDVRRLCEHGRLEEALRVLQVMDELRIGLDCSAYASLLQECINQKALAEGKVIHAHMADSGFEPDMFLETKLVIMYAKCGSLMDARQILDEMPKRNVVSWTAMIAAYARHGHDEEAMRLFRQMQREGVRPNQFTFGGVLSACGNLADLKQGQEIHEDIARSGFLSDIFVGSALVDMYAKCGKMDTARKVFDQMPERNVVSWNALIAGYVQNGHVDEALKLFQKMPQRDVISWNTLIAGYAQNERIDVALKLFQKMLERNVVSWNMMIAGYARNGRVDEALKLFQKLSVRDVVSWTAMIAGYAQNGCIDDATNHFRQMLLSGEKPDSITFTSILPARAYPSALKSGKQVHENIITRGFHSHIGVVSTLVDMYAKCGSMDDARKVFDQMPERNVVSWNALIAGYGQNGHFEDAVKLFQKVPERDVVSWNAMIAGYAQSGHVDEGMKLFHAMPERNAISWTTMIAGYVQNSHFNEALKLFQQMQLSGAKPDSVTFTSILPACANLAALKNGKEVHENIIKSGYQFYVSVGSSLVDMYAKSGAIEDAYRVFDTMTERDMASWNAMIVGYAKHGCGKEALQLFEQMQHSSIKPDHITFIGVLTACSHAGLVNDGWHYFSCMHQNYHITPAAEHYCCMVDLLGRAGHLDQAYTFINKMPIKPNADVWRSLLGACKMHNNSELGECVAGRLFELDTQNAAGYVLLSNIYAGADRWDGVEKVRKMMKDRGVKKIPGCSWIEVNNKVCSFLVTG